MKKGNSYKSIPIILSIKDDSGDGNWKLHIPHNYRTLDEAGKDGAACKYKLDRIE